jgi:hypothetical protein
MRHGIFALILCFLLLGCEKPNPHPELLDPIYRDIQSLKGAADSAVNGALTELKEARAAVEEAPPQTGERRRAMRGVEILEKRVRVAQQRAMYFEILLKDRKKFARKQYIAAFNEKKPWPPPENFESYKVNKRLREVSLKWDDRLPRLESRLPAAEREKRKAEAEAAKKKAAGGGGGH